MRRIARPALALLAPLALAVGPAPGHATPEAGGPPRVLIVTTSHAVLGDTGYPTGVWLAEVTHPYFVFLEAGYEIDVASVAGGKVPVDPYSDPLNPKGIAGHDLVSRGFLSVQAHAARLETSLPLASVDPARYAAVVFAGGNGAIFDLPGSPDVARVGQAMWDGGKVVAALCHGSAALVGLKDRGAPLVKGRKVTGFTDEEEAIAQAQIVGKDGKSYLPFLLEVRLRGLGADWQEAGPFRSHAVVDGRLVTGQQNLSGLETARRVVEAVEAARR